MFNKISFKLPMYIHILLLKGVISSVVSMIYPGRDELIDLVIFSYRTYYTRTAWLDDDPDGYNTVTSGEIDHGIITNPGHCSGLRLGLQYHCPATMPVTRKVCD